MKKKGEDMKKWIQEEEETKLRKQDVFILPHTSYIQSETAWR
jgi:hypothetical protein